MECDRYLPDAAYYLLVCTLTCALTRPVLSYQKCFWTIRQRQDSAAKRLLTVLVQQTCVLPFTVKSHAGLYWTRKGYSYHLPK